MVHELRMYMNAIHFFHQTSPYTGNAQYLEPIMTPLHPHPFYMGIGLLPLSLNMLTTPHLV